MDFIRYILRYFTHYTLIQIPKKYADDRQWHRLNSQCDFKKTGCDVRTYIDGVAMEGFMVQNVTKWDK